ncbi:hypothetical protein pdam_00014673, partial [Pocillopora damicornis]
LPGDNCSVFGCGTRLRTKEIEYKKWWEEWLNELTKTRVIDNNFQNQINNGKFNWKRWQKKKRPKFGALPTFNMPKRSHDMVKPVAHPLRSVVQDKPVTESHHDGDVNSFPHKEYWRTCSCTVLFE